MTLSTLQIASIITIFQSILMAVFFFQNKKNPRMSNVLLASLLIVFSILVGCSLIINLRLGPVHWVYSRIVILFGQSAYLVAPLFFFYIRSLLNVNFTLQKRSMLHFIPFILAFLYTAVILIMDGGNNVWTYPGRFLILSGIMIQNLLYLTASWKDIRSCGLTMRLFLSYIDNSRLSWMRYFTVGYIMLWSAQLQLFIGWDILRHPEWCPYGLSLYFVTAFVFFNGILLIALRKPESFYHVQKYQSSVLKQEDKDFYKNKLIELMDREKLYLNPSIVLNDLAQKLELAPCSVSQVINESFQQNFRDFVNRYRIEESKHMLVQQNQNLNILGIALDAGFNSKSAFNNAFKKHTGITPKEFKKKSFSPSC